VESSTTDIPVGTESQQPKNRELTPEEQVKMREQVVKTKALIVGEVISLGIGADLVLSQLMAENPDKMMRVRDFAERLKNGVQEVGKLSKGWAQGK